MASETKTGTSRKTSSPAPKVVKKAATKTVAAAGKTAAKSTTTKKAAAPAKTDKPAAKRAPTPRKSPGQPITADTRLRHIEVAAYYIAENSGFSRSPADCWIAAESEVDGLLLSGKL